MPRAYLQDRGVVEVSGENAADFLQGIITCDIDRAAPARFGALLTPQGKILFDFILARPDRDRFLLDVAKTAAPELAKRLSFYKLRAKVAVVDLSEHAGVLAGWDEEPVPSAFPDPRTTALGWRAILPLEEASALGTAGEELYHAHRIHRGVPESGRDFVAADTFPHEADMDQLAGVDFDKGCFIGQEVVARMQHRSTVRTRAVPVVLERAGLPQEGTITAGGKAAGRLGSSAGDRAIAVLRLDRVADALAEGQPIRAGDMAIQLVKPEWARFAFPGEDA